MVNPLATILLSSVCSLTGGGGECSGGHDGRRGQHPEPVPLGVFEVTGSVELSPSDARDSAIREAGERASAAIRGVAEAVILDERPIWLPEFLAKHAHQRRFHIGDQPFTVLENETVERKHSFGRSYQTRLQVQLDSKRVQSARRQAHASISRAKRLFPIQLGSIAGVWALLAFLVAWFDRLSRGYMTGRLRLIGGVLGLSIPAAILLL